MKKNVFNVLYLRIFLYAFLIFVVVWPVMYASAYSFMLADDFAKGMGGGKKLLEILLLCFENVKEGWLEWQGTYTSYFFQTFFWEILGKNIEQQIRIVLIVNIFLFMVSIVIFFDSVSKELKLKINQELILLLLFFAGLFMYYSWTEAFYWITGAMVYSWPLSFGLIGNSLLLRGKRCILAGCCLLIAVGGSLEVVGIVCFMGLVILAVKKIQRKLRVREWIIFGISILGALINTVAPGNFVRHVTGGNSQLQLGAAISSAFMLVVKLVTNLLTNTPFIVFLVLALFLGTCLTYRGGVNNKVIGVLILGSIVAPFICCFPVCLGYDGSGYFPNRCEFVAVLVIEMSLITISMILGYVGREKFFCDLKVKVRIGVLMVMLMMIISVIRPSWKLSSTVTYQMWNYVINGTYKQYYTEVIDLYSSIANDSNEDVFIYSIPESISYFPGVYIPDDMTYWVNASTAYFYGKKSLQFVTEPLCICGDGRKRVRIYPDMFVNKGYVTIEKISNDQEKTQTIQNVKQLNSNLIVELEENERGKLVINVFKDAAGKRLIEEKTITF